MTGSAQAVQIDHFEVRGKLARGGMGIVYLAYEPDLDRKVALKFLSPELSRDERIKERFAREAKAAASLQHPNIVSIFFRGTYKGQPYFAMELIEGESLEERAQKGPLPPKVAIDYMLQCCAGLSAAWNKGRVHRDIKPGNIMVTKTNIVKITDFGLAKALDKESGLTSANMVVGTPDYISPEQAQGDAVDCRSDIYSLGASFYFLLCGKRPFVGDSAMGVLVKHISAPLTPLGERRSDIPPILCRAIERMMAKKPEDRYQTYRELMDHLEGIDCAMGDTIASGETIVDWSQGRDSGVTEAGIPSAVSGDQQAASPRADSPAEQTPERHRPLVAGAGSPTISRDRPETRPQEPAASAPGVISNGSSARSANDAPVITTSAPPFEPLQKGGKSWKSVATALSVLLLIIVVFYLGKETGKEEVMEPTAEPTALATVSAPIEPPRQVDEFALAAQKSFLEVRTLTTALYMRHYDSPSPLDLSGHIEDFDIALQWPINRFNPETAVKVPQIAKVVGFDTKNEKEYLEKVKELEKGLTYFRIRYPCSVQLVRALHTLLSSKESIEKRVAQWHQGYEHVVEVLNEKPNYDSPDFKFENAFHYYDAMITAMRASKIDPLKLTKLIHKKRLELVDGEKLKFIEACENAAAHFWLETMIVIDKWKGTKPLEEDFLHGMEGDFDDLEATFLESSVIETGLVLDRLRQRLAKVADEGQVKLAYCNQKTNFKDWIYNLPSFSPDALANASLEAMLRTSMWIEPNPPVPSLDELPPPASPEEVENGLRELRFADVSGVSYFDVRALVCFAYTLLHSKGAKGRLEKASDRPRTFWRNMALSYTWDFTRSGYPVLGDVVEVIRALQIDVRPFVPWFEERKDLERSLLTFSLIYGPRANTLKALRTCVEDALPDAELTLWQGKAIEQCRKQTSKWRAAKDPMSAYRNLFYIMRLARIDPFHFEDEFRKLRRESEGDLEERWAVTERSMAFGWYVSALLLKQSSREERAVDVLLDRGNHLLLPSVANAFASENINSAEIAVRNYLAHIIDRAKSKGVTFKDRDDNDLGLPPQIVNLPDHEKFSEYGRKLPEPKDEEIRDVHPYVLVRLMSVVDPMSAPGFDQPPMRQRQVNRPMNSSGPHYFQPPQIGHPSSFNRIRSSYPKRKPSSGQPSGASHSSSSRPSSGNRRPMHPPPHPPRR